jgi:hypothetical protein
MGCSFIDSSKDQLLGKYARRVDEKSRNGLLPSTGKPYGGEDEGSGRAANFITPMRYCARQLKRKASTSPGS